MTTAFTDEPRDDVLRPSKRQPTDLAGMATRAEVVDHYRARSGFALADWTFYEVFGLFRYHYGQTTNPAFKDFWLFVTYLDERSPRVARAA